MASLATHAWMLEAVSQLDGEPPSVHTFVVGLEEEADCIRSVKEPLINGPKMAHWRH